MQTFLAQQNEVLRYIDEVDDVDVTRELVKQALNRSYHRVLGARVWPFMKWPNEETLTTVSGTRIYALKPGLTRILTLWDVANRQFYPLIPRRQWEQVAADRTESVSVPVGAIYGDTWPVQAQPSAATTLRIVSSSVSDTATTITLTGIDSSGEAISEALTASGTTQVTSTNSFAHIYAVAKAGTWVGTMTLSTSAGTTLLTLKASQDGKQYPTLEFIETPNSARVYTWTAQRAPLTLSADGDIPEVPYPYCQLHVYDALLDLTAYNTELGAKEQRLWTERLTALRNDLENSVDELIVGSQPRFIRDLEPRHGRRSVITS